MGWGSSLIGDGSFYSFLMRGGFEDLWVCGIVFIHCAELVASEDILPPPSSRKKKEQYTHQYALRPSLENLMILASVFETLEAPVTAVYAVP